jgi:hypothetical protein
MEAFCRVLDGFSNFAAAQQICRLSVKWRMRGKYQDFPPKSPLFDRAHEIARWVNRD